jgi:hemerythrin superfamily protein
MAMDAVSLLESDHRAVDQLFREYEGLAGAAEPSARRQPVERMIRELSVHAGIEEQVLYPTVRQEVPDGAAMEAEARREHEEAKETLRRLDRMDPSESDFDSSVRRLIRDVRHHLQEEEGDMFPKLRTALDQERLTTLGARMQEAKRTVPTRP